MVRTGPVQALQKPPQLNNNVKTVLEKSLVHKTTTIPSKRALVPSKQPAFSNSKLDYGSHSSKYSDLFIMPSPNPNMYVFDSSQPAYPLDTVIPSYPPVALRPQKTHNAGMHYAMGKTSNSDLENLAAKSSASELENMLKVPESDLASLLSLLSSSSSEPLDDTSDFAIPSTSGGIFDSFPAEMFQEAPQSSQEPVDMWREEFQAVESSADVKHQLLPTPPEQPLLSEPARDPLDCSSLWLPPPSQPSISPPLQFTPPLVESFSNLSQDMTLATPSFPFSHPTTPTTSESSRANRESLSMEEQLDFLDSSLDLDPLFPPTKKLQENPPNYSEASSPVSLMHTSPVSTPHPSPPPTPVDVKPAIVSPPPSPEPAFEKAKPSPLLFGKHEDDILHKVLIPRPGFKTKSITREKLVSMPVEEFNRLLDMASLTDIEVAFMKEWRRRGKNKTAAMVARKRKRDELTDLDVEVGQLRRQRAGLQVKYDQLQSDISALRDQTRAAEKRLYQRYSQKTGFLVSHDTHMIHVDEGGKVVLVPRLSQQMLLVK